MPEIRLGFLRAPSAVSALFAGIVHAAKLSDLFAVPTLELLRPEDLLYMHVKLSGVSRGADGWWSAGSTPGYITFHFPPQHVLEEAVLESEPSSKRRRSGRRPPDDEGVITLPLVTLLAEPSRVVVEVPPGYRFRRTTNGLLQALNDLEMKLSSSGAAEPIYRGPRSVAVARAGISSAIARAAAAVQPYSAATAAVLGRLGRMIEPPGEVGALTRLIAATVPGAFASASSAPTRIVAPRRPAGDQTSIEIPFRLLMAPLRGRWNHRVAHPQPSPAERYELWHTRLAIPRGKILDENPDAIERRAVALWTDERPGVAEDVITAQDGTELRSSLSAEDRAALVVEMRDRLPQRPHVHVRRWMLTSLGGWIDLRGEWPKGKVTGWEHRTTLGRDQFVRVTYPGWLWPLGHLATRIKITERKLLDPARDVAILWQREFLRIDEPHRLYSSPRGVRVETPFTSTEIGVRETPTLTLDPLKVAVLGDGTPYGFPITAVDRDHGIVTFDLPMIWVSLGPGTTAPGEGALQGAYGPPGSEGRTAELRGQRIGLVPSSKERPGDGAFEARSITLNGIVGEDERGIPRMKRAALFVEAVRALTGTSEPMEVAFHDRYIGGGANPAKMIFQLASGAPTPGADFSGATDKVGGFLSPSIAMTGLSQIQGPVSGTAIEAGTFDGADFFKGLASSAKLFGAFSLTEIIKPGGLADAPSFITESFDAVTSVVAEVRRWKELVAEAKKVATAAVGAQLDKATVHLDAIAAEIAKLATALGGPDPTDAIDQGLEAIEASLTAVGGDLTAIIDLLSKPFPAAADVARRLRDAARFFQKANEGFGKTLGVALRGHAMAQDLARNQTVRLSWSTQLEKWPSDHPVFDGRNGGPAPRLLLEGELRGKAAHGKPAGVDLVAQIDAFDLNLVGKARLLILHFDKIAFRLLAGKKPDLDVVFGDVEFTGPLTFVQTLRKVIPLDGFSDPPALDVSPKGITGSFSIALPNLAVGVFSLQNLSLSAGFTIPFIGDTPLTVRFGFCSREQPFVLTVSMLGGGGFFAIAISPNGIETMEAALEFGACLAVDLGVASGSVSIMAGVYFKKEKGDVTLTGYLRVRGEVQVLGMISASLELYMSLTYEGASGSVIGKASLEITVKVLFFSASVKVEMEKRFKGGNADPTFLELMAGPPANPLATWNEYRAAFAAAA